MNFKIFTNISVIFIILLTNFLRLNSYPQELSKIEIGKYLPQNPIILEAGAYIGNDTEEMAQLWPQSTIYAFEPIPDLFHELTQRTVGFANVKRFKIGLGTRTGTAKLYISSGISNASSSLLQPKEHLNAYPTVYFDTVIEIPIITIDEWARANNIEKIDFLWLDLQGYEMEILKASPKIFGTVKVLYTEVNVKELYEGCGLYKDFRPWLESEGFKVVWEGVDHQDGNVLFVRQ